MLLTKIKKNQGFTIVETLIVLAIAALILIIVLIAVPDLQRSAKNSNIRSDAQNVASAIQTFEGNNQGEIPGLVTAANGVVTVNNKGASGVPATGHIQNSTTIYPIITTPTTETYSSSNDTTIYIETNSQCPTSLGGTVTPAGNQRGVVIIYPIDSGGGNFSGGCIQD